MCKAAAEDALAKFESASSDLYKSKFMQVSSGRPNVNLEFLDLLNEKWKDKDLKELSLQVLVDSTLLVELFKMLNIPLIGIWERL